MIKLEWIQAEINELKERIERLSLPWDYNDNCPVNIGQIEYLLDRQYELEDELEALNEDIHL